MIDWKKESDANGIYYSVDVKSLIGSGARFGAIWAEIVEILSGMDLVPDWKITIQLWPETGSVFIFPCDSRYPDERKGVIFALRCSEFLEFSSELLCLLEADAITEDEYVRRLNSEIRRYAEGISASVGLGECKQRGVRFYDQEMIEIP